jgi:hypothetical protein
MRHPIERRQMLQRFVGKPRRIRLNPRRPIGDSPRIVSKVPANRFQRLDRIPPRTFVTSDHARQNGRREKHNGDSIKKPHTRTAR